MEVESRKLANSEAFFIFDDVADSFDHKNEHAIDVAGIARGLIKDGNCFAVLTVSHLRRDKCNINELRLIRSRGFLGRGSSSIWLISRNKRRRLTSSLSRLKWEAKVLTGLHLWVKYDFDSALRMMGKGWRAK